MNRSVVATATASARAGADAVVMPSNKFVLRDADETDHKA